MSNRIDPRRNQQLHEAIRGAVEATRTQNAEQERLRISRSRHQTGRRARFLLAIVAVAIAWIWIGKPTWIFGARPTAATGVEAEAEARYGIYLEQALVEEYIQANGKLPESSADLGPGTGVEVTFSYVSGGGYSLSATGPGGPLVYSSRMDVDSFLGNSIDVLQRKGN